MNIKKSLRCIVFSLFCVALHAERIKLYTFYTPSHEVLLDEWFLPSLLRFDEYDAVVEQYKQECPKAEFMAKGWTKTTRHKIDLIIHAIEENKDSFFIYSDVDIQFFKPMKTEIDKAFLHRDMVFQKNNNLKGVCTGFIVCRANERTLNFWHTVAEYMDAHAEHSDQHAVNKLLREERFRKFKWGFLPDTFFGSGLVRPYVWEPGQSLSVPSGIIMHHANYAVGVEHKIAQLQYVRKAIERRKSAQSVMSLR